MNCLKCSQPIGEDMPYFKHKDGVLCFDCKRNCTHEFVSEDGNDTFWCKWCGADPTKLEEK